MAELERTFHNADFHLGGNRASLSVTLFQASLDAPVRLSAIASGGGSQALLFKINAWGENAFLNKLIELL